MHKNTNVKDEIIIAHKKNECQQGIQCYIDNKYTIYNSNVTIKNSFGKILAIFRKNIVDPEIVVAGRKLLKYKASTRSRGMAAGISKKNKAINPNGGFGAGNMVNSSIVGYTEANGFYNCRQTMLYKKHKEFFDSDTMKILNYITKFYEEYAPDEYKKQKNFVDSINQNMRLGDSVFTTITVNVDFRTCTHTDKGDYHCGLGNLLVFDYNVYNGGELLLPEYEIGFNIQEGDILLFDSHEIHCNNEIRGKGRISLVCYAREKISTKCNDITKKELEDNSSIYGVDRSKKTTRSKKK